MNNALENYMKKLQEDDATFKKLKEILSAPCAKKDFQPDVKQSFPIPKEE
jgi:hypothetical protein